MLNTERNAYNSNAQQQPKSQVRKANPNAAQEYPKNIHQHIEATVGTFPATNLFAERPQGKACHFQGLHAKRDANNGEHHQ